MSKWLLLLAFIVSIQPQHIRGGTITWGDCMNLQGAPFTTVKWKLPRLFDHNNQPSCTYKINFDSWPELY